MIMNIKQRKIKIEPKTKLNYNIYMLWGFSVLGQLPQINTIKKYLHHTQNTHSSKTKRRMSSELQKENPAINFELL